MTRPFLRTAFGQALVILATLVPVVAGQHGALAASVFCSSVAGLLLLPALAAVPTRLPGVADDEEARDLVRVGVHVVVWMLGALLIAAVVRVLGLGAALRVGEWRIDDVAVGVLLLLVAQGAYVLLTSWYTRQGDMDGIAFLRRAYGAAAVCTAVAAVLLGDGFYPVILSAAAAMLGAAVATVAVRHRGAFVADPSRRRLRAGSYPAAWRSGWRLALAGAVNGFTAQAAGLVVPALGGLAEVWAVILRVGGGATTIMQAVVAPFIERRLGASARAGDAAGFRLALLRGWAIGLAAGAVAAAAAVIIAVVTAQAPVDGVLPLLAGAAALYFLGQTGTGAVSRALAIAGSQGAQLAWDLCRFAVIAVAVAVLAGAPLLIAISVAVFVFAGAFVVVALRAPRRLAWRARPDAPPSGRSAPGPAD